MTSPVPASSRPGGTAALPRCAVCGTESRQAPFRASPPEQAPDLDLGLAALRSMGVEIRLETVTSQGAARMAPMGPVDPHHPEA